jgi:two-component system alkaline phosphatase synthesis response regulator PhoP
MKDLKVLVIDPDFDYLQLISQFLATDGFHVVTAIDGEEGLRKAMIESPDLILIEPMLSKLHGFTLCNIVSKEFKKKIPVIILTNHYQDDHYKKEAIQVYGAAAYLKRPIMKKELRSAIFKVLGKKSMGGVEEIPSPQVSEVNEPPLEEPKETISTEIAKEQGTEEVEELPQMTVQDDSPERVMEDTSASLAENQLDDGKEMPQEDVAVEQAEVNVIPVETPTKSSGNNGNGSNGKSKVDRMIDDIESEFGLVNGKKVANSNQNLQI